MVFFWFQTHESLYVCWFYVLVSRHVLSHYANGVKKAFCIYTHCIIPSSANEDLAVLHFLHPPFCKIVMNGLSDWQAVEASDELPVRTEWPNGTYCTVQASPALGEHHRKRELFKAHFVTHTTLSFKKKARVTDRQTDRPLLFIKTLWALSVPEQHQSHL